MKNDSYKNEIIKDTTSKIDLNEKNIKEIGSEFEQFKMEATRLVKAHNEKKEEVHKKEEFIRNEIFEIFRKLFF